MAEFLVRKIEPEDNPRMASVIREVMTEFGAVGSGFSIEDPEVDFMYEAYQAERSIFYVVLKRGHVVGGAGIAPLEGGKPEICELKKMYFSPEARGQGAGKVLGELLLNDARKFGFSQVYIETLEIMSAANHLYRKLGFRSIDGPLGNTGHCGCNTFYIFDVQQSEEIVFE